MPTGLRNDAGLLHAYRAGDDSAFEELVRRHAPRLRRQCARIVGPDDAEDAVQQALLSASRALRAGDDELDVGRWLHRVAHNAAIDALRRRPPPAVELDDQIDGVPQPPDVAAGRESLRATVAAIQQLPDAQRRALLLSVFEDHSWEEIARELGTGESAVRGLLHRARTGMRAAVALAVFPFFLLRIHAARAATTTLRGGGSMGATAKAGVAVVVAGAAGGTAAVIATQGHHHRALPKAAPLVAEATRPAAPAITTKANTLHIRKRHRHHAKTHATTHRQRVGRSKRRNASVGQPNAGGPSRTIATVTPTAPAPSLPNPTETPTPTQTTQTTPTTQDTTPAQQTPPAQQATTPADTTPTYPPAPSTVARIDSWSGGSTNNPGTLHVIFDDGRSVTGYVTGDGTAITCDHVQDGRLTSSESCTMASLSAGQRVVSATYHQLSSGSQKFDTLEIVVQG